MVHNEVYKLFEQVLPNYACKQIIWFPNGKNSIRIRLTNKMEYIFSYNNQQDWKFETITSFIENLNKRSKEDEKQSIYK